MKQKTVTITIEGNTLPESNEWLIGLSRGYGHPTIISVYTNDFIKEVDTLKELVTRHRINLRQPLK